MSVFSVTTLSMLVLLTVFDVKADVQYTGDECSVPTAVLGFNPPVGDPEPDTFPRLYTLDRIVTTLVSGFESIHADTAVDLQLDFRGTFTMFSPEQGAYDVSLCESETGCVYATDRFLVRRVDAEGKMFRVTSLEFNPEGDYFASSLVWDDRFGLMIYIPICERSLFNRKPVCEFECTPDCICTEPPPMEPEPEPEPFA